MNTVLLTWSKWPWHDAADAVKLTAAGQLYRAEWSVHAYKQVQPGDRVFVMKQGKGPTGIVAAGMVVSEPRLRPHWDPERTGEEVYKVEVDLDRVLPATEGSILPRELLEEGVLAAVNWNAQASGISIAPEAAVELERIWGSWLEQQESAGQKISVTFDGLVVGGTYERPELAAMWGYKDWHAIGRGIVTPAKHNVVILFVTREKQAALTQYQDHFEGDELHMDGETNHAADQRIVTASSAGDQIHLFYRDRHHSPFT
jgi:hypothetical protein